MSAPDRRLRAMIRDTRLRELGFTDYAAYLRSPAWRDVRERYKASDLPQICMCGATKVQLHHTTYERVGREQLDDLIPLCGDCHTQAHILEAEGIIELDLKWFYYDPERAKEGQLYLAQLKAACPDGEVLRADKRRAFEEWRAAKIADRGRQQRVVAELIAIRPNMPNRHVRQINGANERKLARLMADADQRDERLRSEATPAELAVRSFSPDASDGGHVARRSRLPENDRG